MKKHYNYINIEPKISKTIIIIIIIIIIIFRKQKYSAISEGPAQKPSIINRELKN